MLDRLAHRSNTRCMVALCPSKPGRRDWPILRQRSGGRCAVAFVATLLLVALLGACSSSDETIDAGFTDPATRLDYTVEVEGAPEEPPSAAGLIEASLALTREQAGGAASLAFLRRRANGDTETVQKILRSFGYYAGEVRAEVVAPPEDAEPGARMGVARILIAPGPQFTLAAHDFTLVETGDTPPDPLDAATLGSPVGGPAVASEILAAEQAAVAQLRSEGRPYAAFRQRAAVADLEATTIEVESTIETGSAYVFGPLGIEGAPSVDDAYLRTYVPWEEGAVFDVGALRRYQERLFGTGLFVGASVLPPEDPPEGAAAPVTARLEEGPFRSIALGARFSTDQGPSGRVDFEHRNLFGANERLGLTLDAGFDEQIGSITLRKPQYLRDGQDFTTALELRHVTDDANSGAFDETGATLTAGLERRLGPRWTVGAGGLLEASLIDDGTEETEAYLAGLPLFAAYDGTDDKLDPTRGQRLRISVTPFTGFFNDDPTAFTRTLFRGSAYQDLTGSGRYVLAQRGRIGFIFGGRQDKVPSTRRFYSGGGGSVRGYEEDIIGPLDATNDPEGGLSVAEAGIEFRFRVLGDLGLAVFTEAGLVSEDTLPDFADPIQVAAGLGLRYYSPIGPIRVDVGFPLNGRDVDDTFQAYIAIGQAF